ncbi:MAG: DUF4340 domain-containing protein [Desulfobulbaceae bacterium]|nr:DUF4340 domain-containing protein [Desulfobulbaceae bacterium]
MMSKKNSILLGLLLIQALLIILFYRPASAPGLKEIHLAEGITADNIVELAIVDNAGKQVVIKRNSDKEWQIVSKEDSPEAADSDKINAILARLSALTADRLVTRTPASHLRLKVADNDFEKKISVKTKNGQSTIFFLGSASRAQGVHIRVASQDEVYITQGISSWEFGTDTDFWKKKKSEMPQNDEGEQTENPEPDAAQ